MIEEVLKWIRRENLIEDGDEVIAGVSGGADSVCLLLVLLAILEEIRFSLRVVHVEHGIRGEESLLDAEYVEKLCREKRVPCRVYHVDVPVYAGEHGIGLEEAARLLRYDCYRREAEGLHSIKIALAHHADDNAETVLFQMVRGSGIRGLCGIRAKRTFTEQAEIIRPLLHVTRKEIEAYLKEQGQTYRTDSTNLDTDYSRNRIRHEVLPELSEINSQAVSHIAGSAKMLQEVSDYLDSQVKELLPKVCQKEENRWLIKKELFEQYPSIIQKELILSVLGAVSGSRKDIGNIHVESILNLAALQVGRQLSLPYGVSARRSYEGILLMGPDRQVLQEYVSGNAKREPKEQGKSENEEQYEITPEQLLRAENGETVTISLPDGEISFRILDFQGKIEEIPKKKYTKWLDYDKMKSGVQIRKRAGGDYLVIDEAGHQKKLKAYFIEEKIPIDERGRTWLIADASHIIWVIGSRISADYRIQKNTEKILEIQMTGGNYYED